MTTCMRLERDGGVCPVHFSVMDTGISWSFYQDGLHHTEGIKIQQLLLPRMQTKEGETRLIVQYAKVSVLAKKKIQLRCAELVFISSYNDCVSVKTRIEELLQGKELGRPKRVLLFMNPVSGFGTSVKDFHNIVVPLFEACGVSVDGIVTKSGTHAAEVLEDYDLMSIDAVASMGGDGAFSQVINGLVQRAIRDAHNDPDDEPVTPSLAFGAIPGGWTEPLDIFELRHESRRVGFAHMLAGFGVITDTFDWLEQFKWMGRFRLWFVLLRCWWTWRKFDVTIYYRPFGNSQDKESEPNTTSSNSDENITDGPWPGWKTLRWKVSDVWITKGNVSEICQRAFYTGSYIRSVLKTGKSTVYIFTGANFTEMMRAYRTMLGIDKTPRSYLHSIDVAELKVRVSDGRAYSVSLDGDGRELPDGALFETKIHSGLLTALALNREIVEPLLED